MRNLNLLLVVFLSTCLLGCQQPKSQCDPLEPMNRVTFQLNRTVDSLYLKPTARLYEMVIPCQIRGLITNFLHNINEIPNVANDLLQGKPDLACKDAARFLINSTWGILGFVDLAAHRAKLPYHRNDFGQTLACWGYKDSAYLVLPIIGPSTIRDTVALVPDWFMYPPTYLHSHKIRNILLGVTILDTRTAFLKASPLIEESLDEYTFMRDAFYQHRAFQFNCCNAVTETSEEASGPVLEGPPE
jgi:phospholipid-binding lipoprotein MlaA